MRIREQRGYPPCDRPPVARRIAPHHRRPHAPGGDVGLAEDLAQDALLAALEQWPSEGLPDNPGAWLLTTARRRAIDQFRRRGLHAREEAAIQHALESNQDGPEQTLHAALDDPVGDDLLGLVFIACHPVLPQEARVACWAG